MMNGSILRKLNTMNRGKITPRLELAKSCHLPKGLQLLLRKEKKKLNTVVSQNLRENVPGPSIDIKILSYSSPSNKIV